MIEYKISAEKTQSITINKFDFYQWLEDVGLKKWEVNRAKKRNSNLNTINRLIKVG